MYVRLIDAIVCLVQFERTLIVADEDSDVSYLEGCTAPSYDKNQACPRTNLCFYAVVTGTLPAASVCQEQAGHKTLVLFGSLSTSLEALHCVALCHVVHPGKHLMAVSQRCCTIAACLCSS